MNIWNQNKGKPSSFALVFFIICALFLSGLVFTNLSEVLFPGKLYHIIEADEMILFKSSDFPLSFYYPSKWIIDEVPKTELLNDEDCFVYIKGGDPSLCISHVEGLWFFTPDTNWPLFLIGRHPNTTLPDVDSKIINGTEWSVYNYTYKGKDLFNILGKPHHCKLYVFGNEKEAYALDFCTHEINSVKSIQIFEEIMQSVHIELVE